jgi:hypothetical protein
MTQAFLGLILLPMSHVALAVTALLKSKAEWTKLLPEANYAVLFETSTERAGTSPLNHEKRAGTYLCFACNFSLFKSELKFDSGTGYRKQTTGAAHMKTTLAILADRPPKFQALFCPTFTAQNPQIRTQIAASPLCTRCAPKRSPTTPSKLSKV